MRRLSTDEALTRELEGLREQLARCRDDEIDLSLIGSQIHAIGARLRGLAAETADATYDPSSAASPETPVESSTS